MSDQFIVINSPENVTYSCSVPAGSTVVWEVDRSQIRSQQQFNDNVARGIFIEPMNTESASSTMSISAVARDGDDEILVQCLADQGISGSVEGETYRVITFGKSGPFYPFVRISGDSVLEHYSDTELEY